jgi:hypothetical protein
VNVPEDDIDIASLFSGIAAEVGSFFGVVEMTELETHESDAGYVDIPRPLEVVLGEAHVDEDFVDFMLLVILGGFRVGDALVRRQLNGNMLGPDGPDV